MKIRDNQEYKNNHFKLLNIPKLVQYLSADKYVNNVTYLVSYVFSLYNIIHVYP
jgi:hypothetical protein